MIKLPFDKNDLYGFLGEVEYSVAYHYIMAALLTHEARTNPLMLEVSIVNGCANLHIVRFDVRPAERTTFMPSWNNGGRRSSESVIHPIVNALDQRQVGYQILPQGNVQWGMVINEAHGQQAEPFMDTGVARFAQDSIERVAAYQAELIRMRMEFMPPTRDRTPKQFEPNEMVVDGLDRSFPDVAILRVVAQAPYPRIVGETLVDTIVERIDHRGYIECHSSSLQRVHEYFASMTTPSTSEPIGFSVDFQNVNSFLKEVYYTLPAQFAPNGTASFYTNTNNA